LKPIRTDSQRAERIAFGSTICLVDDKAHVDFYPPTGLLRFVFEPLIQLRKLAVVEVSLSNGNAIGVATGLVERVIGRRAQR